VKEEGQDFLQKLKASQHILIHLIEDPLAPEDRFDIIRELRQGEEKV